VNIGGNIDVSRPGRGLSFTSYLITYDSLVGGDTAEKNEVTIECVYWRNPIIPALTTGFLITTMDPDGNQMDLSDNFTLDASSFTPFPVLDTAVTYIVASGTVQGLSDYTVQIESPIPFEVDGCYVKYIFPKEL
jgi:hypothetical protein